MTHWEARKEIARIFDLWPAEHQDEARRAFVEALGSRLQIAYVPLDELPSLVERYRASYERFIESPSVI